MDEYYEIKDAPSTRRRVTSHYTPARMTFRGPDHTSPAPDEILTPRPGTSDRFPDIQTNGDGTIVLCPGCSGSDASRDGDYFICRSCGSLWRRI